jgi:two-component system chemotaxis response regulator CheB
MPIRVLVAEDSLTVRKRLVEVLSRDPGLEVIAEAGDGRSAIELCQSLRPDVVTLDMMMPVQSGLAATEFIMAYCPTPILIVSASLNRGEVFKTFDALAAGALDVLDKPSGDEPDESWEGRLVSTVKLLSRVKVITHPRARLGGFGRLPAAAPPPHVEAAPHPTRELVAIGASTGGPGAVLEILRGLGGDFPLPILLVLHLGQSFGAPFVEWLDGQSPLRARNAVDGERLPPPGAGVVLVAPPNRHLVLRHGRLHLTDEPERHACRPSVDVLFESLAREAGPRTIACQLTGMGRDGAAGLVALRASGAATLAQDEASSVVFGMPREAILLGGAGEVLPLDRFAPALRRAAGRPERPAL